VFVNSTFERLGLDEFQECAIAPHKGEIGAAYPDRHRHGGKRAAVIELAFAGEKLLERDGDDLAGGAAGNVEALALCRTAAPLERNAFLQQRVERAREPGGVGSRHAIPE